MSDCEPSAADVGPRSHTGEAADLRSVAELLEPGGRLLLAEPLLGGVSANVMRLDIERPDHTTRSVVFRQHCAPESKGDQVGLARMEFELLGDLHRRGLAVAEPLLLDDSGKLTDPYLVSELIAGSTEVTETELSAALDQMAQFLADLHALDVGELTISGLVSIEDPAAGALRYLPATESGVAAKRALSGMVPIAPNEPVLLHGDYWPGNVLWHRGQLAAVIDWEDACLGDPLADLATARVELLCQYGPEATEHFTRSYLSRAPASLGTGALPLWEVYVSSAALASMHSWGLGAEDEKNRRWSTFRFFERAVSRLERDR